jgi:hypothetical protein
MQPYTFTDMGDGMKYQYQYQVIDYCDVWGSEKEGWEVNDLRKFAIVEFKKCPPTDTDILKKLKSIGYLKKTTRLASIVNTGIGDADFIEYKDSKGFPAFRLERIYE